jgi:hypothetical protein
LIDQPLVHLLAVLAHSAISPVDAEPTYDFIPKYEKTRHMRSPTFALRLPANSPYSSNGQGAKAPAPGGAGAGSASRWRAREDRAGANLEAECVPSRGRWMAAPPVDLASLSVAVRVASEYLKRVYEISRTINARNAVARAAMATLKTISIRVSNRVIVYCRRCEISHYRNENGPDPLVWGLGERSGPSGLSWGRCLRRLPCRPDWAFRINAYDVPIQRRCVLFQSRQKSLNRFGASVV